MRGIEILVALGLVGVVTVPATGSETRVRTSMDRHLAGIAQDLIEVRRDLHRHPEVSGTEERTAGVVASRMKVAGLEVRTGIGGHGVVAILKGARPGPIVAMRADMDAVPSSAPDPVEFASETPGVRHICGHDVHTTVAIAVAEALASVREDLPGTAMFIFQPAEENGQGARAMLDDGALDDPTPEASFAFHTAPLEVGQVGSQPGVLLAGRDLITVTLKGDGDLKAAAQELSGIITGLSTITREQVNTSVVGDFRVAGVFDSRTGDDGSHVLRALVTTTTDSLRQDARQTVEGALVDLKAQGIEYSWEYSERVLPGVTNDPEIEAAARLAIESVVGEQGLVIGQGVIPGFSEDFGAFQEMAPGAMFWLGVSNSEAGTSGMPHTPNYVADEGAILLGARVMSAVLLDYMGKHAQRR